VGDTYLQKENFMNNTGRTTLAFLTGLGIRAGLAALFAPVSGEEAREWMPIRRNGNLRCYAAKAADRSDGYKTR